MTGIMSKTVKQPDTEKLTTGAQKDDDDVMCNRPYKERLAFILWLFVLLFLLTTMALIVTVTIIKFGPHRFAHQESLGAHESVPTESLKSISQIVEKEGTDFYPPETFDPTSIEYPNPPNSEDKEAMQVYLRKLYEIQEAKLRALKCKPIRQVVRISDLLEEDPVLKEDLQKILIPDQAVVLSRCLGKASYCPDVNQQCIPPVGAPKKTKEIAIMVYNATLGRKYPTVRRVEIHENCICQQDSLLTGTGADAEIVGPLQPAPLSPTLNPPN